MYFVGIDLGSSYTKCVLIDPSGSVKAQSTAKSGISFADVATKLYNDVVEQIKVDHKEISDICSTGVGRYNCNFATMNKPEIICFAKGAYFFCNQGGTVVDIGGQDNKIIKLSKEGKQLDFKMNRKCAAGTGAFLQEIAMKMDLTPKQMDDLARQTTEIVTIGSYCTVFAATEIIHHIRTGENLNAILRGVYASVVKRVMEMDTLTSPVILTGGAIATHPVLIDLFHQKLGIMPLLPEFPQIIGAHGAALIAMEHYQNKVQQS